MNAPARENAVLGLVHEGWRQLKRQRPLAAWGCWQRALRLDPENRAATEALSILEAADDLPAAARAAYRFRFPANPDRRTRWNAGLGGSDIADLEVAAEAFHDLAAADVADASAWYNLALCQAWKGANAEAIEALDACLAAAGHDLADPTCAAEAAEAWALAEVLRPGSDREDLVDDLSHAITLPWSAEDPEPQKLGAVVAIARPIEPDLAGTALPDAEAFEWLDRPMPEAADGLALADLPRVLATVIRTPKALRLSSPDPSSLDDAHARVRDALATEPERPCRRQTAALPLSLLDAAVWSIRLPAGLDHERRRELSRSAVEHYYENIWIHIPRRGLGAVSPLGSGRCASRGDAVARGRLAGVIRVREQLGARRRTAELYGGYPFDRLRQRLGLEPDSSETVDPADVSCMSETALDALDPCALDDVRLAEACDSAAGLGDDSRTARFAEALLSRGPGALPPGRVNASALFAALVRQSLAANESAAALAWLDRGKTIDAQANAGRFSRVYDTWRAEILARIGDPDAALRVYEALVSQSEGDARVALDAAATMLDRGYPEHTRPLAERAAALAEARGDTATLRRAQAILAQSE